MAAPGGRKICAQFLALGFVILSSPMKLLNGKEKQKCRPTLLFQHGGEGGGAATTAFMAKSPVGN